MRTTAASGVKTGKLRRRVGLTVQIGGSIVAIILGSFGLGVIIACVGSLVLDVTASEKPGTREFAGLGQAELPVSAGGMVEARSAYEGSARAIKRAGRRR